MSVSFSTSPLELITFGGTFNALAGLVIWWLAAYLPSLAYALLCTPT